MVVLVILIAAMSAIAQLVELTIFRSFVSHVLMDWLCQVKMNVFLFAVMELPLDMNNVTMVAQEIEMDAPLHVLLKTILLAILLLFLRIVC